MIVTAKPLLCPDRAGQSWFARLTEHLRNRRVAHRRRRATLDLIHASPHLLRDIGFTQEHSSWRQP